MKAIVRMYAIDAAILFALLVLQITFGTLISIDGIGPDFLMIWLVVIALSSGQLPATLFGFAAGLALDLYAGELVGLSALAAMTGGFAAGYFHKKDKIELLLRTTSFATIAALAALIRNIVALLGYYRSIDSSVPMLFLRYGIGSAAYTALFALAFVLIRSRAGRPLKLG